MNIVVTIVAMIAERLMVLKVWRVVLRMIVRILVNVVVSGGLVECLILSCLGRVTSVRRTLHSGKVRGQIWTFLKLKLEVR